MKNSLITNIAAAMVFAASVCGITSCSCTKESENKDAVDTAEERNEAKFSRADEKDAKFIMEAAENNMAEIELAKLAQKQAVMQEVKDLAKMLEDDHTKALSAVKALAAKKMISIPETRSNESTDNYNKIAERTGNDFDKEFCDKIVESHKESIREFEKAEKDIADMDIRNWAAESLPVLRKHLDEAMKCVEKLDKKKTVK